MKRDINDSINPSQKASPNIKSSIVLEVGEIIGEGTGRLIVEKFYNTNKNVISGLKVKGKRSGLDTLISHIEKKFKTIEKLDSPALSTGYIKTNEFIMLFDKNYYDHYAVTLLSNKKTNNLIKILEKLQSFFDSPVNPDEVTIAIYSDANGHYNREERKIHRSIFNNIYEELYPTIDIKLLRNEFIKSTAKILILAGEPGTGKTSFAKYMIGQLVDGKRTIAYVKDGRPCESEGIWTNFLETEADFIIFDDIDISLTDRSRNDSASAKFISRLLSYTDGININNSKIIVTTNQKIAQIDSAILRPGRLFDVIELGGLTYEQARHVWENVLKASNFTKIFPKNREISQAELMQTYQDSCRQISRPYYKNGAESYLQNVRSGKVGF